MVRLDPGGTVTVIPGSISHGQGHETMYKILLSHRLGLDETDIRVAHSDTDLAPDGGGTFASRTAVLGGSAATIAADKVVAKARKIAAHALEAAEDDIEFADGFFRVVGTDRAISLKDIAHTAYVPSRLPEGLETGLYEVASFSPEIPNFPNGCHVCEVEVDPETGATRVLRYVVVDDVGTVINPLTLAGQIHGGVAQGIGQAFTEHLVYEERLGQPLSGSFMDYGLPRADEAVVAALAAGTSSAAMAQYAPCPPGYALYGGVCQPAAAPVPAYPPAPTYPSTNPVSGAAAGGAAGAAAGGA